MTQLDTDFSVRFSSTKAARSAAILFVVALVYAYLGLVVRIIPWWLTVAGAVLMCCLAGLGLYQAVRARSLPPVVRLDSYGVTVAGAEPVPWSDLTEVRLMMLKPQLLFGGRRHQIAAFLPRPGVRLPGPPTMRGRPYAWFTETRERCYGTNLIVQTLATQESAEDLAAAARRLGALPVTAEPVRPVRRWIILLGGAVVAGVLAAIVVALLDR